METIESIILQKKNSRSNSRS